MKNNLSEFISSSIAIKKGDTWTVYVDGENKRGAINDCTGSTEFEAKESAYKFYIELFNEINKQP